MRGRRDLLDALGLLDGAEDDLHLRVVEERVLEREAARARQDVGVAEQQVEQVLDAGRVPAVRAVVVEDARVARGAHRGRLGEDAERHAVGVARACRRTRRPATTFVPRPGWPDAVRVVAQAAHVHADVAQEVVLGREEADLEVDQRGRCWRAARRAACPPGRGPRACSARSGCPSWPRASPARPRPRVRPMVLLDQV